MMSKFSEIVALLPKALTNADKIVEGWINDIKLQNNTLKPDEVEEIAKRRAICETCPFNSANAKEQGFKTRRASAFCIHCGCPLTKKTASLSSNCGIEEYNQKHPKEQIPLKWTAYENSL